MGKGTFNDLLNLDLSLFENSLDPDLLALSALIENTCLQLECCRLTGGWLVGWFCCFTSQVNSYGHCGTVSSPNHTFSWAGLKKRLTSNCAHTFACN